MASSVLSFDDAARTAAAFAAASAAAAAAAAAVGRQPPRLPSYLRSSDGECVSGTLGSRRKFTRL